MYIYHALINALSAHILYTRRAQSHQNNPHKAPCGKINDTYKSAKAGQSAERGNASHHQGHTKWDHANQSRMKQVKAYFSAVENPHHPSLRSNGRGKGMQTGTGDILDGYETPLPVNVGKHCREWQARSHNVQWWFCHQRTIQAGASLPSKVIEDSAAYTVSTSKLENGGGSSHPCSPLVCLKRWQSDHTYHHPGGFDELATKSKKWNGKPRLEHVSGRHPHSKTDVGVLPWTFLKRAKQPLQMICFS